MQYPGVGALSVTSYLIYLLTHYCLVLQHMNCKVFLFTNVTFACQSIAVPVLLLPPDIQPLIVVSLSTLPGTCNNSSQSMPR